MVDENEHCTDLSDQGVVNLEAEPLPETLRLEVEEFRLEISKYPAKQLVGSDQQSDDQMRTQGLAVKKHDDDGFAGCCGGFP